eukprot:COSAG04_NODE_465_length_13935_cov_24.262142_4_plen_271_part_00
MRAAPAGGQSSVCGPVAAPLERQAAAGSARAAPAGGQSSVCGPCRGGAVAQLERQCWECWEAARRVCSPPPCGGGPRSRCAGRAGCPASPDSGRTAAWAAWWSSNAVTCRLQLYCCTAASTAVSLPTLRVESDGRSRSRSWSRSRSRSQSSCLPSAPAPFGICRWIRASLRMLMIRMRLNAAPALEPTEAEQKSLNHRTPCCRSAQPPVLRSGARHTLHRAIASDGAPGRFQHVRAQHLQSLLYHRAQRFQWLRDLRCEAPSHLSATTRN